MLLAQMFAGLFFGLLIVGIARLGQVKAEEIARRWRLVTAARADAVRTSDERRYYLDEAA